MATFMVRHYGPFRLVIKYIGLGAVCRKFVHYICSKHDVMDIEVREGGRMLRRSYLDRRCGRPPHVIHPHVLANHYLPASNATRMGIKHSDVNAWNMYFNTKGRSE